MDTAVPEGDTEVRHQQLVSQGMEGVEVSHQTVEVGHFPVGMEVRQYSYAEGMGNYLEDSYPGIPAAVSL